MDSQMLTGLAAVAAVVVVALLARGSGKSQDGPGEKGVLTPEDAVSEGAMPAADELPEGDEYEDEEDDEDFDEEHAEVIAITSDNFAIVPDKHAVRIVPPDESGEAWKPGAGHRRGQRALDNSLHAGEYTGARIVRGDADEAPWRLEALGRDGEYAAYLFETREAADAALALFVSRRVVTVGEDEDGVPIPASSEQFEEARRVFLETEAALTEEDPEDRP
ncbi:MAG: hypothetical protein HZA61_14355 [Candidatus Eisenbacteria bacterium]|uniref:Uncharacterized protein n=1 Tax=Eiseniibacteriota bacterium TaxID=2212470 RepID=A0A933W9I5_UNCEI|nr:hypothetical protein [Candidatus Eisenbacteria bacterium]